MLVFILIKCKRRKQICKFKLKNVEKCVFFLRNLKKKIIKERKRIDKSLYCLLDIWTFWQLKALNCNENFIWKFFTFSDYMHFHRLKWKQIIIIIIFDNKKEMRRTMTKICHWEVNYQTKEKIYEFLSQINWAHIYWLYFA